MNHGIIERPTYRRYSTQILMLKWRTSTSEELPMSYPLDLNDLEKVLKRFRKITQTFIFMQTAIKRYWQ